MDFLNGIGGQVLLGAIGLGLAMLFRYLGRRFDVTEEQAREFLNVLTDMKVAGEDIRESALAKEVQKRVRKKS